MPTNNPIEKKELPPAVLLTLNPAHWERLPLTDNLIGRVVQCQMQETTGFLGDMGLCRGELLSIKRHPSGNVTIKTQITTACFPDLRVGAPAPVGLPWEPAEFTCCRGFRGGIEVLKQDVSLSEASMPRPEAVAS